MNRSPSRLTPVLLALLLFVHALGAVPAAQQPASNEATKDAEVKPYGELRYRSIGPAQGGRLTRVAGVAGDPRTYYAAVATGGVWKSVDGGASWSPIFDDQPTMAIGSIAVAVSDPNVIYVGSGEANIRGNVAPGLGIFKSTDAGKTWTHVWKQAGQIGTMAVHPRNADVAFAAVLGHAFGPNPERGVYRTKDGGATWQQVLKKDADTGASDVAIDPSNPSIVFAGFWQTRRQPWGLTSGGPGSGLYVSRDGGDTWTALTGNGLPEGPWGKVGVAVAASDGRRVYALIEAEKGGLFRSDDGGRRWSLATANRALRQRAWYYSTVTVNPRNSNEVWFPQVPLLRSIDGGKTIEYVKGYHHGDHHDIWIDPADPKRMIIGNDGGPEVSTDGGETWRAALLPIGQFYHVSVDTRVPFRVAGAQQDLGTAQGPSNSLATGGIDHADWYTVGGGEAGHVVSDWSNPDIVYAGEYLGIFTTYDHKTRQVRATGAWPDNPSGWAAADLKYRFQWTAPIAISPHDAATVYHAAQVVFRTRDRGQTWEVISPDLTRNDRSRQQWSGGPITGDNTGVETYGTVFALAESPREAGLIWAGSDDGLVHVTRDAGGTWTNVTANLKGLPQWGTVSIIEPSPFDAATAYLVVDNHRLDDMTPYLFKTADYGRTWTRLDGPLARDVYLHAVREDPHQRGTLYLGTERGVMLSRDDGATWEPLQLNLPAVPVHDLVVKDRSLVVGTHGRSIWVLDDLTPVRQMGPAVTSKALHVFPAPEAVSWRYAYTPRRPGNGQNPPRGAVVAYWLKEKPEGEVVMEITDAAGALVRRLSSVLPPATGVDDDPEPDKNRRAPLTAAQGLNVGVWDLRWTGATVIRNAKIDMGSADPGPLVLPGTYTAKIIAGSESATTTLTVVQDPRLTVTAADLEAQHALAKRVVADITRLSGLVESLRDVKQQLASRKASLAGVQAAAALAGAGDAVVAKLDAIEARLHNPTAEVTYDILAMQGGARLYSRLVPFFDAVTAGDGAPTQGQRQVYELLSKELDALEKEYRAVVDGDIAALNAQAASLRVGFVSVK